MVSIKAAEGLKIINPKAPKFYITFKIHKENYSKYIKEKHKEVNSINCHTFEIQHFVDHRFQHFLKSYIKDTNNFVNKININIDINTLNSSILNFSTTSIAWPLVLGISSLVSVKVFFAMMT